MSQLPSELLDEILLLFSSTNPTDDFQWAFVDDDASTAQWQTFCDGGTSVVDADAVPSALPAFRLRLCQSPSDVQLSVSYNTADPRAFNVVLQARSLANDLSVALQDKLNETIESVKTSAEEPFPLFAVYNTMRQEVESLPVRATPNETSPPSEPDSGVRERILLKRVLIWSHHLLATSKRKLIVQGSSELGIWGLSKPGYPGAVYLEGIDSDVDELVRRIKAQNWKALSVRSETSHECPEVARHDVGKARRAAVIAPVLDPGGKDKPGVREIETLGEMGDLMKRAGLEDVFFSALKMSK